MRRLWIVVAGLVLALILAALLALRSESLVLAATHWAMDNFTDLRLELRNPRIDVYGGTVSADEVHLIPRGTEGPALVSALDFSARAGFGKLFAGSGASSTMRAHQVLIYVSENDEAADPAPTQWLQYLGLLPGRLEIDQVHLITASANTWIFPLKNLQGERLDSGNYSISASADYGGEPLDIALNVFDLVRTGQTTGATIKISFMAPESGSDITLEGQLEGTRNAFGYDLTLDAYYRDISEFLRGFEGGKNLAGELRLDGKMTGDIDGFVLSDARFVLDNKPEYGFEAAGELQYDVSGESRIELLATGEVASLDYLLTWADLDVGELGSARSTIRLSGSLDRPVVDELQLATRSAAGLTVNLVGQLDLFDPDPGAETLAKTMEVELRGPSLQVLQPWLGEIAYDPGPWHASALVTGNQQQLTVSDLAMTFGAPGSVEVQASGSIGNISKPDEEAAAYSVNGIELSIEAQVPDSAEIAQLLEIDLPGDHEITANFQLAGSDQQLAVSEGSVLVRGSVLVATVAPITAILRPGSEQAVYDLGADVGLTVTDSSALSVYAKRDIPSLGPLRIAAKLAQQDATVELNNILATIGENDLKIQSRGRVADLAGLAGIALTSTISGVSTREVLGALIPDFQYDRPLGSLSGDFKLSDRRGIWRLSELAVRSGDDKSPLQFTAEGNISDLTGLFTADLTAQFKVTDPILLEALTGLPMNPVTGSLVMTTADEQFSTSVKAQVGTTSLSGKGLIAYKEETVQGVKLALTTPQLHLQDFGFATATAPTGDEAAAEEAAKPGGDLAQLRDKSPPYPVDLTISIGGVSGDYTNIDSINIHVTGKDHRYTLEQFSVGYDQSLAEVRGIIDLNPRPPAMSLAVQANAVPLSTLTGDLGVDMDISGSLTALGGLTVMGNSTDELLRNLNGSLAFALEQAVIEGAAYDVLATDLLAWVYSGALNDKSTFLDCTMAKFRLSNGVATTDSLYIESAKMIATGKAEFDLVNQQMDLSITPLSKSRVLQLPSRVRLKGPMSNPKADVSPLREAADAASAALMLIPDLTMKLFGIKPSSDDSHRPCQAEPAS
jgi:hypothetical protein